MTYHLHYRITATGVEQDASFDSMLSRALFLITWSSRIDVLREWVA